MVQWNYLLYVHYFESSCTHFLFLKTKKIKEKVNLILISALDDAVSEKLGFILLLPFTVEVKHHTQNRPESI